MKHLFNTVKIHSFLSFLVFFCASQLVTSVIAQPEKVISATMPVPSKAQALMTKIRPQVVSVLQEQGLSLGQPVFLRIFKMPGTLEVWLQKGNSYQLFKTYQICTYSGYPGPKLYEGDWQSPEGFYSVTSEQLNPNSQYHLSFDIGYPNTFDRARKRTGSSIMVHGDCSSRGCFAMGDSSIEEIYLLTHAALSHGQQQIALHIFPFRMTTSNLKKFQKSPWINFWKTLQQGFLAFEATHRVPQISVDKGKYIVKGNMQIAMSSAKKKNTESMQ